VRKECLDCYIALAAVVMLALAGVAHAIELSEEFRDQQYGYSIKHPSSWNAVEYRSGVILSEINRNDNKCGLQIRFLRSNRGIGSFVDNYLSEFKSEMQATVINKSPITIDQHRGREITFRARRGGKEYFLKSYVLRADDRSGYFVFQAGTPFRERKQVEPILDEIAFSFRL